MGRSNKYSRFNIIILNHIGEGRTPYEIWHNKNIDFEDFKAFGEKVFVHIPKQLRLKWDAKAKERVFNMENMEKKLKD